MGEGITGEKIAQVQCSTLQTIELHTSQVVFHRYMRDQPLDVSGVRWGLHMDHLLSLKQIRLRVLILEYDVAKDDRLYTLYH